MLNEQEPKAPTFHKFLKISWWHYVIFNTTMKSIREKN